MMWIGLAVLLLLPLLGETREHVLAWTYTTQPQDRAFVVERCRNQASGCPMGRIATVSPTTRRYTDRTVQPRRRYCYQVGVQDPHLVYQWSNMVCGP